MYLRSALFEPYNGLEKTQGGWNQQETNQTKPKISGTRLFDHVLLISVRSGFELEDLVQSVLKLREGCPLISPGKHLHLSLASNWNICQMDIWLSCLLQFQEMKGFQGDSGFWWR